jgi:hypothetical protein
VNRNIEIVRATNIDAVVEIDEDTRVTESALARRSLVEGLARRGQE